MLTDQIHRALTQCNNRFKICRMTAKGVQVMHKPGERFEATISMALDRLAAPTIDSQQESLVRGHTASHTPESIGTENKNA